MSNTCDLCGKIRASGGSIVRRGLAKSKGGIGMHVVKNTKRVFKPNIQSAKVKIGGTVQTIKVCASCIRSGKVAKA